MSLCLLQSLLWAVDQNSTQFPCEKQGDANFLVYIQTYVIPMPFCSHWSKMVGSLHLVPSSTYKSNLLK